MEMDPIIIEKSAPAAETKPEPAPPPSVRETLEAAMAEATAESVERETRADDRADRDGPHRSSPERQDIAPTSSDRNKDVPSELVQPAPDHWSQADKETFAKLPAEWQRWTLEQRKAADAVAPLLQAIEGAKPYLASRGTDVTTAVKSLLSAEYTLRHGTPEQKRAVVDLIVRDYGIDLNQEQPVEEWEDPSVKRLRQEVQTLQGIEAQRQHAAAAHAHQQRLAAVKAFEDEKGADGKPLRPHFKAVGNDMVRIAQAEIAAGRNPTLQQVYDQAIWSNPQTRKQLIAEHQAAQQRQAEVKQRQAAKSKAPATIRELLEQAMRS
jgi:hypothetical protein